MDKSRADRARIGGNVGRAIHRDKIELELQSGPAMQERLRKSNCELESLKAQPEKEPACQDRLV